MAAALKMMEYGFKDEINRNLLIVARENAQRLMDEGHRMIEAGMNKVTIAQQKVELVQIGIDRANVSLIAWNYALETIAERQSDENFKRFMEGIARRYPEAAERMIRDMEG